jgi:ATP-binding cassette subfamily F protein 3
MSLLVANGLAKSYGANDIFENIDLRIEQNDRIGLVGPNGAGKSSLLKVLAGIESSNGGVIYVAQGIRVGYLPQDAPSAGEQTLFADLHMVFNDLLAQGAELRRMEEHMTSAETAEIDLETLLATYGQKQEAFERAGGYTIEQRIKTVLTGLGLAESLWTEPLAHLSGGQRTRALLGRLLLEEPDLLMLDEPTNHLDVRAVEWLEGQLLAWKGALVVVSHDRYFLDRVATRIWDLAHHRLETYRGNYSHYRIQRAERLAHWQKEYEKQQKFISETETFIRRYKAGQRSKEAQGRETRLQRFREEEALPPPPSTDGIRLPLRTESRSGDLVVRTRNLVVGYKDVEGNADKVPILAVPDTEIRRGQVVALVGPNGAGKTTLVRTLLGELEPLAGTFSLGTGVEVGYLAQQHVGAGFGLMNANQSVLDALLDVRNLPLERARTYLGQFLFRGDDVFKTIDSLSGGQRSRIALARLTLQGANFLLLDEPTNHLDLDSQEILQDALNQFTGTILLVTHDRALVEALATQLWIVENEDEGEPSTLTIFNGTWQQWLDERNGVPREEGISPDENETQTDVQRFRERQRQERRQRQEISRRAEALSELEQLIERMETKLAELEKAIAQASLEQDREAIDRLNREHQALSSRLEAQMERWTDLAEMQQTIFTL